MSNAKKRPNLPGFIHPKFDTPQDCYNSLRDVRDLTNEEKEFCVSGIEKDDNVSLAAYTRGVGSKVHGATERFVLAIIRGGDKEKIYTAISYAPPVGKERDLLTRAYQVA
jgi:hypothetical protein